jgi:hypothetical protein
VEYRGRCLYSRVAPRDGPERTVRDLDPLPETLYVVPSPLLGYGLSSLLEKIPESSAVLALEADPVLAAFSRSRLPPEVTGHPKFRFLDYPFPAGGTLGFPGGFRRASEVRLSAGRVLHPEAYDAALRTVDAELNRYWRNRMTLVRMGRLWIRNIFRNLARLPDAGLREPAAWTGPVAVCGAGPSLDGACDWLRSERSRLRVLACDTALGPLVLRGIRPDAVVCLEGQIHNLKDFLPAGRTEVPVFADLTSHPSVFHAVRGPKILTLTRFEDLGLLDRLERLPLPALPVPPLGSVGVLAVHLARRLTDGPVFLTGLDFSFPAGTTHAQGAPAPRAEALREDRLYKARGQWNATWPTPPGGYRAGGARPSTGSGLLMETYAALLAEEVRGDPRVFDIRGTGLPLGLERITFKEASTLLADPGICARVSGPVPVGRTVPRDEIQAVAASFLEGEAERLEGLLSALGGRGDLAARVSEFDWIHSWFPDADRVRELSGDVRNRLLAEALDWKRRVREARTGLEEP